MLRFEVIGIQLALNPRLGLVRIERVEHDEVMVGLQPLGTDNVGGRAYLLIRLHLVLLPGELVCLELFEGFLQILRARRVWLIACRAILRAHIRQVADRFSFFDAVDDHRVEIPRPVRRGGGILHACVVHLRE